MAHPNRTTVSDGVVLGHRLHHPDAAGVPLVMLHGSGLSQTPWRGLGYVTAFADRPVLTPDMRGHGRSDGPHEPTAYAAERLARDVVEVLDALDISTPVDVLGYSAGARIGLAVAAIAPDRIRRLVLVAGSSSSRPGTFERLFFPGVIESLETTGIEGMLADWERHIGAPVHAPTRAALAANDPLALAAYFRAYDAEPGLPGPVLARLDPPTLLVVGELDRERLADAHDLHDVLPDSRLVVLPGLDHGSVLAATAEVVGVARGFLDAATPEDSRLRDRAPRFTPDAHAPRRKDPR